MKTYTAFGTRITPQSQPIPGSVQVANNAGGFSFPVDDWKRLDRFLILGTEGGSYYANEKKLTLENAEAVRRCIVADGVRVVNRIVEISDGGRAAKNDPALFALAMCVGFGDDNTRKAAYNSWGKVARTGTHLFHLNAYCDQFKGWGRGRRRANAEWYNSMPADKLAYQAVKYQKRDGWSHHDILHLAHPKPATPEHNSIYQWAKTGKIDEAAPKWLRGFAEVQKAETNKQAAKIIAEYKLPRECVPTQFLTSADVWAALLEDMPLTALIRNLATMTRVGLLAPLSKSVSKVTAELSNAERLKKSRVHPIALLSAMLTYAAGQGVKSDATWEPVGKILDALDAAFYLSFGNVTPTNKRMLLALDVSGSMSGGVVAGVPGLSPRVASSAMALITAATEKEHAFMGFATEFIPLTISPRQRLNDVCNYTAQIPMGGTDCSLPMLWAMKNKISVDAFVVYTDSETWAGQVHPVQALRQYRDTMGIRAKLIVVGMVSNGFSIADPGDAGMLDVVGFDTAAPQMMSEFVAE